MVVEVGVLLLVGEVELILEEVLLAVVDVVPVGPGGYAAWVFHKDFREMVLEGCRALDLVGCRTVVSTDCRVVAFAGCQTVVPGGFRN